MFETKNIFECNFDNLCFYQFFTNSSYPVFDREYSLTKVFSDDGDRNDLAWIISPNITQTNNEKCLCVFYRVERPYSDKNAMEISYRKKNSVHFMYRF